jgi:dUTP pyrophosphatase
MKNLFLLRHAKSSWDNAALGDFDRPLSKRGISNAIQLSEYIQKHSISFDLVLSSPSERTQSTLDLVLSSLDPIPTSNLKECIYHASASSLTQLITDQDDEINNLLIIGHNPGLHILTETLTNESIVKFPTCAFAKITNFNHWKDVDAGILTLESVITPRSSIMIDLKVKILNPLIGDSIPLPEYSTEGSAGLDLRACVEESFKLKPQECKLIPLGFSIYIEDPSLSALVIPRSGLGSKHGIVMGNLVGLIDSDYQGELKVPLWNRSSEDFLVSSGDRIAQMILVPIKQAKLRVVEDFSETERGNKGFGSSGVE